MTSDNTPQNGPLVLVVMDGVGVGRGDEYDAVELANTPNLDSLRKSGRFRTLRAHGTAVGLPSDADMGNSEVGHNILGAGRIFDQGAKRVDKAIASGAIWRSKAWTEIVAQANRGGTLHFVGLLSDGNVHSHIAHLVALLERAASDDVSRIRLHALFDGRDVTDYTATKYVNRIRLAAERFPGLDFAIASGGGRMCTTMDRYGADWRIVEAGWDAHVLGTATAVSSAEAGIELGRRSVPGVSDQFLPAFTVVDSQGDPIGRIEDGDAVVFFNFRGDRAMEFAEAIEAGPEFDKFERSSVPSVVFAGMALYDGDTGTPKLYLVEPERVADTVSELVCRAGISQWAGAETQKYGHITYFWNGNRSDKFDEALEEYHDISSDQVPFEQRPWMKSAETADAVISAVNSGRFGFIRCNFAGGDMVGHTAHMAATRIAVESVDLAIGRIIAAVRERNGCIAITADHGNADDKAERDADGVPRRAPDGSVIGRTAHSLNAVPFMIKSFGSAVPLLREDLPDAGLANVGATVLQLLGVNVPSVYAPSLLC